MAIFKTGVMWFYIVRNKMFFNLIEEKIGFIKEHRLVSMFFYFGISRVLNLFMAKNTFCVSIIFIASQV